MVSMHDPWVDRISEYIDGDMGADEARAFETHRAGCASCRDTFEMLREIVAAARTLEDRSPARDLWTGIAAGIAADAGSPAGGASGDVIPLRAPHARRFSFSMPQLAAAALVLMSVSAGAAWLVTNAGRIGGAVSEQGTIFQAAGPPPPEVRLAGTAPPMPPQPTAGAIEDALAAARASLDPATVDVLERSIESINAAIADAHAALEADPGNPYLQR
jgi:hypothetical protein